MTNITEGFRSFFGPTATTNREFGQYVSGQAVDARLAILEHYDYCRFGQVCYVVGMGGHPRSSYDEIKKWQGVRVVFCESVLPRGLRFIPSYRGVVRVDSPPLLGRVFEKLMEQAMVAAYIFDMDLEEVFLESVRSADEHRDHSFGIKADPRYLIYFVDSDRDDSPTGIVEFVSHGTSGPWKDLFREGEEKG